MKDRFWKLVERLGLSLAKLARSKLPSVYDDVEQRPNGLLFA